MKKRTPEDFRKAITFFKSAVEKDPNYALAYSGLADTYRLQEQYGGIPEYRTKRLALKAAEQAMALDSLSAESQTSLGGAYLTGQHYSKARDRFKKAIELNPNYLLAYHWLGITYSSLAEKGNEIQIYEEALKRNPMSPIISGNLANAYLLTGQMEKGLNLHKQNINLFPDQATVYIAYARALRSTGEMDESIQLGKKALSLDSLSYWMNINLPWTYYLAKEYEKSIDYAKKMMKKNTDFSFGALIIMGMSYRGLGNQETAEASFQQAIQLDPLATEPRRHLAQHYFKLGEYEKALNQHEKNMELYPDEPEWHLGIGEALATMGKYKKAFPYLENAVELDGTWFDMLGLVYYLSGDINESIDILNKAIQLYPQNTYAIFYLAVAQYSNENFEESTRQFNKYFKLLNFPNRDKFYSDSFQDNTYSKESLQKYLSLINDKMVADKIPMIDVTHQAAICAITDQEENMLEYLYTAHTRMFSAVHLWMTAPIFKPYHSDPEFITFFKKLKLDKYHQLN